ncbi:MAG: 23S rRNA (guanosine(2251)-2'-O)-methyltransferase RlmB [Candidatus Melainabacteria bacterium RIFOXYA12_FULL_32_12]|nr:MAG: 23S rRNA (guanosine(2251)-2'-O)-methyltransferase RlmB [Candidatus Melainabacteria bacterium RIFOXYA12_FULL_32_12]
MEKNEIVYGRNSVEALLETSKRRVNKLYLAKGIKFDSKMRKIIDLAKNNSIPVQEVPREKLNLIAEGSHQGIAASVSPIAYMEFDDLLNNLKNVKNSLVIILDGVEDPHNFGSIVRTAVAAGADGIIIPKRRSTPVTSTVEKASAGTVEKIPIVQVTNIVNAIEKLKENNFWIFGAESTGEKYYFEADYNLNCTLVVGGEGQGISTLVKKHCDILIKIPMPGKINSLNVANATSIIIYEILRQRLCQEGV